MSDLFPVNEGDWDAIQFNFDRLAQLAVKGGGRNLGLYGVYTADSGAGVAAGAEASVTVNHSLGKTPVLVFGHLEDGTWSSQFGWRCTRSSTNVVVKLNNHGPNVGQAILHFYLLA